jgi:hypothetical protein
LILKSIASINGHSLLLDKKDNVDFFLRLPSTRMIPIPERVIQIQIRSCPSVAVVRIR